MFPVPRPARTPAEKNTRPIARPARKQANIHVTHYKEAFAT